MNLWEDKKKMNFSILLWMIFCHVVDDYYLQGCLANLKQKKFWEENAPQKLYKYDYIVALLMHAFSWSFMIMLPILVNQKSDPSPMYFICLLGNMILHAKVDNEKANKYTINLIIDQTIHILQIIVTFCCFVSM